MEFLPIQEFQNDANDVSPSTADYWGYMTLNYFAPDRRYSSDKSPGGPSREFAKMVQTFHAANIKVFFDVVYNHTGEGYAWIPSDASTYNVLSFRGLDNPSYYLLTAIISSITITPAVVALLQREHVAADLISILSPIGTTHSASMAFASISRPS